MSKSGLEKSTIEALQYRGDPYLFAAWKDRVLVYLRSLTNERIVSEIQAGRSPPTIRFEDLLTSLPALQELGDDADDDAKKSYVLHAAFLAQQSALIKRLFMETLPANFCGDARLMREPVYVIWHSVEKRYGLGTASGVVELVQKFEAIMASDFKSLNQLFHQLNTVRGQLNRSSDEALGTGLTSSNLMMVKILAVLPGHLWRSAIDFTADAFIWEKVQVVLRSIFGNKSKAQIMALGSGVHANHVDARPSKQPKPTGSALGKRKAQGEPGPDMHHNLGAMEYFYCAGVHNDISGGPHRKSECAKRKRDQALNVFRRNISSYPRSVKRARGEPTPKMKGKGKAKGPERTKKVVPIQECLPTEVAVDACNAALERTMTSPAVSLTPPPSHVQTPLTPGSGTSPFDDDEPMDAVVNNVDVDSSESVDALLQQSDGDEDMDEESSADSSQQEVAVATERFASMLNELEDKDAAEA